MKETSGASLTTRINLATLAVIVIGMILGAVGVSWLSYNRDLTRLQNKAWNALRTAELALTDAVWNEQHRQVEAVVEAFMTDPEFVALIVEHQGELIHSRERNEAQGLGHEELMEAAHQFGWIHLHTTLGRLGKAVGRVHLVVTPEFVQQRLESNLMQLFGAAVVLMLLTALAQWLTLRRLVKRPISQLTESARALASGNLNAPIDLHRGDELGILAHSFDAMRVAIKTQIDDLKLLNETAEQLASKISQHETLDAVVQVFQQHLPVERCSVYEWDPEQQMLRLTDSFPELPPPKPIPRQFAFGEGVVGRCAEQKALLVVPDTSRCEFFAGQEDPRFLIAVPLLDQQRLIGVMNFSGETAGYTPSEHIQGFAETLARITVANLKNLEMRTLIQQQNEHLRATLNVFEKFVPQQFQRRVAEEGVQNIRIGQANSDIITILFSDIRNFTSLSESMEPQKLLNFVNAYLDRVCMPLGQYHGFVDKFIGDAVMALFDLPEHSDALEARYAVLSAIDMHRERRAFNQEMVPAGYPRLQAGIGIHSGPVVIGTMGTSQRIETTVLGDSVNLASRLEMLTKHFDARVLASGSTLELLRGESFRWRYLGKVQVKGRQRSVEVHELLEVDPPEIAEAKQGNLSLLQEGHHLYAQRQWKGAQAAFQACLERFPGDGGARMLLNTCRLWEQQEPPEDWDGVITLTEK